MGYVVIADDSEPDRQLCGDVFRDSGLDVVLTGNGEEAVQALDKKVLTGGKGVVITDIRMPIKDGWEVLAYAQRLPREVPIIMMSSVYDEEAKRDALERGAFAYLWKAASDFRSTLLEKVNEALEQRG